MTVDPYPVEPLAGPVDADVVVPGSKSLTNRALICAALAEGTSTLDGVLFADDTEAMIDCVGRLGIAVEVDRRAHRLVVTGGGGRPVADSAELDARLSGTTARFIGPVLALGPGPYRLDGAEPLRARPMGPGLRSLIELGALVAEEGEPGHLPVTIGGGATRGGESRVPADTSSQFASGLFMIGPCLDHGLTVRLDEHVVSGSYLTMTVAVMQAFGATVARPDLLTYSVAPTGYAGTGYRIEPDASAASYFFAAAAITGSRVRVEGLGAHSLQGDLAFVRVLERMGARVTVEADATTV